MRINVLKKRKRGILVKDFFNFCDRSFLCTGIFLCTGELYMQCQKKKEEGHNKRGDKKRL